MRLVPRATPLAPVRDPALFEAVVKRAFATRRKMLRRALAAGVRRRRRVTAALAASGIAGTRAGRGARRSRTSRGSRCSPTRLPTRAPRRKRSPCLSCPRSRPSCGACGPRLRGRHHGGLGSGQPLHLRRQVDLRALRAVAVGHASRDVRRRGKYIARSRLTATGPAACIVHLGMTGRLRVQATRRGARAAHARRAGAGRRRRAALRRPRRFGWVEPRAALTTNAALAALGPDPLTELDAADPGAALTGVRAPIKAFLLDQRRIAGLGNIYVCEALFRAAHPPDHTLPGGCGAARLRSWPAIRAVPGGRDRPPRARRCATTSTPTAARGDNAAALLVYGRAGRALRPVRRTVFAAASTAGRATFFCPACQKR